MQTEKEYEWPGISVIVPVYNEAGDLRTWLEYVVSLLQPQDELILVDGNSTDDTLDIIRQFAAEQTEQARLNNRERQVKVVLSHKGRALQMNAGANQANGYWLWFLHRDSGLTEQHLEHIRHLNDRWLWGRFNVYLTGQEFILRAVGFLMNIRSRITGVMTGDQGIYVRRGVFSQLGGYAEIDLMEDVEFSKRLRLYGKASCSGPVLLTSSRRWEKNGPIRTVLMMWRLRLLYWLGRSPDKLAKEYYRES